MSLGPWHGRPFLPGRPSDRACKPRACGGPRFSPAARVENGFQIRLGFGSLLLGGRRCSRRGPGSSLSCPAPARPRSASSEVVQSAHAAVRRSGGEAHSEAPCPHRVSVRISMTADHFTWRVLPRPAVLCSGSSGGRASAVSGDQRPALPRVRRLVGSLASVGSALGGDLSRQDSGSC